MGKWLPFMDLADYVLLSFLTDIEWEKYVLVSYNDVLMAGLCTCV